MPVVTPAMVRALIDTDLLDADLAAVIAREEAALARAIGPLAGARTETAYITWHPANDGLPVVLRRPTAAVTVTDNAVAVAGVTLRGDGRVVERTDGGRWAGPVALTYTPNDTLEVERVVIELVRLTLTETGYLSETIGEYSYQRGARGGALNPTEAARGKLVASLLPHTPPHTMRLESARNVTDTRPWLAAEA